MRVEAWFGGVAAVTVVCASLGLSACGGQSSSEAKEGSTQTVARVNKSELTVHQVRFALQNGRVPAEQIEQASPVVLERLIDQELALQKAAELKLDRDPQVLAHIEAARRELIAKAYVERIASTVAEPAETEIRAFYDEHPALFKSRKVFKFQELLIAVEPSKRDEIVQSLQGLQDATALQAWVKKQDLTTKGRTLVRAAEQLPMERLESYAALKPGGFVVSSMPAGLQVWVLLEATPQPVEERVVRATIAQYLMNERKRKVLESDLHALRAAAQIQYLGEYAKPKETAGRL